jgi:hypothetical protein
MASRLEDVKRYLGKPITDPLGNIVGKVVGLAFDSKNEVKGIAIESGDGGLIRCPIERVVVNENSIHLEQPWRVEADELDRLYEVVAKRIQALEELYGSGEIEEEIYAELYKAHKSTLEELEERRRSLIEGLRAKISEKVEEIKELQMFLANNKILRASGEVDEYSYRISNDAIRRGLQRSISEKKEMEDLLGRLERACKPEELEDQGEIFVRIRESPI